MRICLLTTLCAILAACHGAAATPEIALRAWLDEMETAAENKDRSAMMDMVSVNYADARGNNRKDIGDTLRVYFFRQQTVVLASTIDEIKVHDESAAEMSVTVAMAAMKGRALGLTADAYHFQLELEKPRTEWLLIGARWGGLGRDLR